MCMYRYSEFEYVCNVCMYMYVEKLRSMTPIIITLRCCW